ncbi:MAG: BMC domain-containing protein [Dehalobacterium sp.]
MLNTRIIHAPRPGTISLLYRRMAHEIRKDILNKKYDAIGLIQTDLPNLFYLADVGQKAGAVLAFEITGNCPQHINTVAFFGDTAAVSAAIAAVKNAYDEK